MKKYTETKNNNNYVAEKIGNYWNLSADWCFIGKFLSLDDVKEFINTDI